MDRILIIGAGQAGVGAAAELRRKGYGGALTVVGDESHAPYQRPPLSKELLSGAETPDLYLYPAQFYADQSIDLRCGQSVTAIDRVLRIVTLNDGNRVAYDHLLLATGARARVLDLPGTTAADLFALRSLDDAVRLAEHGSVWRKVVIVGGGFIGLEVAAFLTSRGIAVTVLEASNQLMGRVVSPKTAEHFLRFHAAAGTRVRLHTSAVAAQRRGSAWQVQLSDGDRVEADAIVSAIGAVPNCELAASAGLIVERGVLVDEMLLTNDPAISAIGDCAVHPDSRSGRLVRLESVQNAVDQGKTFAARMTGKAEPYRAIPWFWSTQGSSKLQIAGLAVGHTDDVDRPAPAGTDGLTVFRYAGERLVAVETVNRPGDHILARRLLTSGTVVPRGAAENPAFNLRSLI